jgi:RNA polymerase primary sigma factor
MLTCRKNSPPRTPFQAYLRDIDESPLLSADEEQDLAYRIEAGDPAARDRMVRANLRLVVNIARDYKGHTVCLEDLIAEGNLGLMRAAEAYDPRVGTRFSTYATYWIRQSIKRAIVNTAHDIRLPAYANELMVKWRRITAHLQEELDRPPTQEEVAGRLNLSKRKFTIVKKALRIHHCQFSIDADGDIRSLEALVGDDRTQAPDTPLVTAEDVSHVLKLLERMDERYATVLRLRFGLKGQEPMTLKAIGDTLGLTRERVRQLEREALAALRDSVEAA